MKHFVFLLTLLPLFTFCGQQKDEKTEVTKTHTTVESSTTDQQTTFYLIRHAEKDRTNPDDPDPSLDIKGMVRAKGWATYFEPINLNDIYITQYKRTKQTASLIAQQKMISPKRYEPNTIYSEDFLKKTQGKTTLIVGHSNTIPYLVNKLIGEEKFKDMDDADNATLFKVTINGGDKNVETIIVNN